VSEYSVSLPSPTVVKMDSSDVERRDFMDRKHETTDEKLSNGRKPKHLIKKAMNDPLLSGFLSELEKVSGSLEPWEQEYIHGKNKERSGRSKLYGLAGALVSGRKGPKRYRRKAKGALVGAIAGKIHSGVNNKSAKRDLSSVQSQEKANLLRSQAKGHPIDPLDRASAGVSEAIARRNRVRGIQNKRQNYYNN
jgi:hypothetical protein